MNNVKKIVAMIMAGFVMLALAGCGKKTEGKTKDSNSVKIQGSDNSDDSASNIASTLICVQKDDAYEKTITVNFDKDDLIIDGKTVTVYVKESDALNQFNYLEESVQQGGLLDAKLEDKTITEIFDINSSSLSGIGFSKESRNKRNFRRYVENLGYECKEV